MALGPAPVLLLTLVWLVPRSGFARIGETKAQIEARMGAPADVVKSQSIYQRGGFTVVVTYSNGVSVAEEVSRAFVNLKPRDNLTTGVELSNNEVQTFLAVYGVGLPWKPVDNESNAWLRSDGKVAATYQDEQTPVRSHMTDQEETAIRKTPSLLISDVAFAAASKRQQDVLAAQQAAQKKQGEANQIASVFGPVVTPPPSTPIPLHVPQPPYPQQARTIYIQGSSKVRVSFDDMGHVSSVTIVQSAGSAILDSNTESYARKEWRGPANSTTTVNVTYRYQ
jgi:TonB family protein